MNILVVWVVALLVIAGVNAYMASRRGRLSVVSCPCLANGRLSSATADDG